MNAYICAVSDSTVLAYAATAERASELAATAAAGIVRRCDRAVWLDSNTELEAVFTC